MNAIGIHIMLPELRTFRKIFVPRDIFQASTSFSAAGISGNSVRLDHCVIATEIGLYFSGQPAQMYLSSAKSRAALPTSLRPIVEHALGCDGRQPFESTTELHTRFCEWLSVSMQGGEAVPEFQVRPGSTHGSANMRGIPKLSE